MGNISNFTDYLNHRNEYQSWAREFDLNPMRKQEFFKQNKLSNDDKDLDVRRATDLTIITNGETLKEVLQAEEILHSKGINLQVIHCPVVKPIPLNLLNMITSSKVVTVENHSIIGGLGSMIAELIAESAKNIQLKRIGVNDEFGQSGTANELLDYYELSTIKIAERIKFEIKGYK